MKAPTDLVAATRYWAGIILGPPISAAVIVGFLHILHHYDPASIPDVSWGALGPVVFCVALFSLLLILAMGGAPDSVMILTTKRRCRKAIGVAVIIGVVVTGLLYNFTALALQNSLMGAALLWGTPFVVWYTAQKKDIYRQQVDRIRQGGVQVLVQIRTLARELEESGPAIAWTGLVGQTKTAYHQLYRDGVRVAYIAERVGLSQDEHEALVHTIHTAHDMAVLPDQMLCDRNSGTALYHKSLSMTLEKCKVGEPFIQRLVVYLQAVLQQEDWFPVRAAYYAGFDAAREELVARHTEALNPEVDEEVV